MHFIFCLHQSLIGYAELICCHSILCENLSILTLQVRIIKVSILLDELVRPLIKGISFIHVSKEFEHFTSFLRWTLLLTRKYLGERIACCSSCQIDLRISQTCYLDNFLNHEYKTLKMKVSNFWHFCRPTMRERERFHMPHGDNFRQPREEVLAVWQTCHTHKKLRSPTFLLIRAHCL